MKKVDLLVAILMAMRVFLDEGSGVYHSKEVDTNRTTIAQLPSMLEKEEDILAINSSIRAHHH